MGDFEGVITLIDAYDLMQSESLNDQEYFSDAYLVLKNMLGTTDEEIARLKRNRVLLTPEDGDASFLVKQQSDAFQENVKNRLNNDIHRFSGCPDMTDQNFAGNASGVAIRYKIMQFENIASVKEREFKRGLQRRAELLCNIWDVKGRGMFDWRELQIAFRRSLPQNLLEIAQTLSELGSVISDETKRAQLPMDIDEETEKQRILAQRKESMSLYQTPEDYEELMDDGVE
jgi:SPP1 family phage portal protein